ncbi:hypothetical protein [Psychroserpens sp.]|uniref:hypothetical protein n=1 Tax=Psychroserpens sp. TaxID=2020870 RepID=UPI002B27B72F|nr:hypothetical protein [Psychroserpens sp.]
MKTYFFLGLTLILFSFNVVAQSQTKEENERIRMERKIEEQKTEFITNIVASFFELDDFQRHILKQRLHSYYDELLKINVLNIQSFEKATLINDLDYSHFKDFEEMLGREFIDKLLEKAKGKDNSAQKKKKKKKKRKKGDN